MHHERAQLEDEVERIPNMYPSINVPKPGVFVGHVKQLACSERSARNV
jgi:hypothetical protein